MKRRWTAWMTGAVVVASALSGGVASRALAGPCDPGNNPVVCENSKPGTPQSQWDITGSGDAGLQGFATQFSVNAGDTEQFKIKTTASSYTVDIYRLGWYQGNGARKVASVTPVATTQPNCLTDASTGLVDCGNWAVSASWSVPSDAVSGVYIAKLTNPANADESQITFVVRNDASHSDVLFQTSDATWQAYNTYGGNDFYTGSPAGRSYKVSYNRPFNTRGDNSGRDFLFSNEFPMLQFLERNGYDVSYMGSLDTDRRGALLLNHKVFMSTGHDEYWSGQQRTNVEAARDAGVNLAFFSGNESYWKTRWEPSIDGTATDGRTLVCYKETWANAKIDPSSAWTGTWRDPRFSPPADGGRPENSMTGTLYKSNFTDLAITVSQAEGQLRLWRNTSLTSMAAGQTTALAAHTIGYESDEDLDNGSRPPGLIRLSTTTGPTPQYLVDYGNTVVAGTTTHHVTLYRASSGALVFAAGTIQWSWGLSQNHDGSGPAEDPRMQQATINILADMGTSTTTVMPGLTASTASTDTTAPTATIASPTGGAAVANGSSLTVSGTAADVGGVVAAVEVSTDNGVTWHPATGTTSWSYTGFVSGRGTVNIKARAIDDSANIGSPASVAVTVSCPCSLFGARVPSTPSVSDTSAVELGVQFVPSQDGFVSGIRFYKGVANTGTHTGSLWTSSGGRLATGTFTNESASGWQTLQFSSPVSVTAGSTYVASYYAPVGRYAADSAFFSASDWVASPLKAPSPRSGVSNGVYRGGAGFPSSTYGDANYYVDVLFSVDDTSPPVVTAQTPLANASSVAPAVTPRASFSRTIDQSTLQFTLRDAQNAPVSGSVAYDATSRTATFTPSAHLAYSSTYTASVQASSSFGVPMSTPDTWSFTTAATDPAPGICPCSIWNESAVPATVTAADNGSVELGVSFKADVTGEIDGVKFYKGSQNVGTHSGSIWTSTGQLLATTTFAGESSTGWQTAYFTQPVNVVAGTTYVVSYHAPVGGYSYTAGGLTSAVDNPPLHTLAHGGLYTYGTGAPTSSSDSNYWVDVVYNATDAAPTVASTSPGSGAVNVRASASVSASLSGYVRSGSATLSLSSSSGSVAGSATYATSSNAITFTPSALLTPGVVYTATVSGATSLSGWAMTPYSWSFTTTTASACPCTLFDSTATPAAADAGDASAATLGVKFAPTVNGYVTGLRFYKSAANTGTHVGSLWTSTGARLAQVTFANETATGWQTATFSQGVQLTVGQTYVVSYFAPSGHYAATGQWFAAPWDNTVLTAPGGANGVFSYGTSETFPSSSYNSSNYWVDPIFQTGTAPDVTPPAVTALSPLNGQTSVQVTAQPSVTFSEAINQATLSLSLATGTGQTVAGTVSYDPTSHTATFGPSTTLARGTTYTGTVSASDVAGNAMTPVHWSFTTAQPSPAPGVCPCSLWDETAVPSTITVNDAASIELGVKFTTDTTGSISGVKFYKGPQNVGTHTGSLWDSAGNRLATATFANESTAGWQTVSFANPVAVTAGTTYIASYTTAGYYSATTNGLGTAVDRPPLHTPAGAGLYLYGGGFPTNASTTNYWVDVVYASGGPAPASTPPVVSAVSATASGTSATVSWATDVSATSVVQYGTTTALGSTASGASGTSHSVTLSSLANATTYYYRVVSADAAGNTTTDPPTTSAPRSFLSADTVPPTVSAVTASGSGTTATVTWTTDESATSSVAYGTTTSLGSTASGATGTSHTVTLSGLQPNTRYYYRVTSADASGNTTTSPASSSAPAAYVPTVQPISFTTVADFATGTGAYQSDTSGGEVTGALTQGQEFAGTTVPTTWTSTTLVTGGTTTVGNNVATVSGSRFRTNGTWSSGRSVTSAATLGAGQSLGWGSIASGSTSVTASFSVSATGALSAQVNDGQGVNVSMPVAGSWTGAQHQYRVDWTTANNAVFDIDGTQVATSAFAPTVSLRVMATNPTTAAPTLTLDWVRIAPYNASSTYTSAVVDAGASVGWDSLTRDALVPTNTTLTIQVRSGATATPGTGWTAWSTVSTTTNSITRSARYLQYRLQFTSSGDLFSSATVQGLQLTFHVL